MSDGWKTFLSGAVIVIIILAIGLFGNGSSSTSTSSTDTSSSAFDNSGVSTDESTPVEDLPDIYDYIDSKDEYHYSRDNWDCTGTCDGHEAGYEWGEEYDICEIDYANGNSESFNEGVRTYAYENCYIPSIVDEYEDEYGVRPEYSIN